MKKENATFGELLKELEKALETSNSNPPAPTIPQEPTVIQDYTEDFLKNKEITKKARNLDKVPLEELSETDKDVLKIRNLMGNIRQNKKMVEMGQPSYGKKIPEMIRQAKELAKKLASSSTGKAAISGLKVAGKVAGPLGVAADVLASEDIGAGEDYDLEQQRKEKLKELQIRKALQGNQSAIKNFQKKSEELAKTPLKPEDLLTAPVVDESEIGEVESPDLEEMNGVVNYSDYLKKRKKMMGYE